MSDYPMLTGGSAGLAAILDAQRANADEVGDGAALDAWAERLVSAS